MGSRVIKTKTPPRVMVAAVLLAIFLVGFLVLAIWQSGSAIERARMAGTVIAKEFVPHPERQVTVGRLGGLRTDESPGEYILTVEVTASDGTKKPYYVWVDKRRYEAVKIGNSFDVGPYLVRE